MLKLDKGDDLVSFSFSLNLSIGVRMLFEFRLLKLFDMDEVDADVVGCGISGRYKGGFFCFLNDVNGFDIIKLRRCFLIIIEFVRYY